MLLFGHAGITLGAAVFIDRVVNSRHFSKSTRKKSITSSSDASQVAPKLEESQGFKSSWFSTLINRIDIRLLLVGSLLPDIIDKPAGLFFFRETFSNGRIFSHTLLFLILITAAGLILYRRYNRTWLMSFSLGTLTHLVFDQMWRSPQTLFWPLLGLSFGREDVSNWTSNIFYALFNEPAVYLPELVGIIILIGFAYTLVRNKNLLHFIKSGRTS
ncbi:metal-dependent hydrolase [Chloroflexota bacterium]